MSVNVTTLEIPIAIRALKAASVYVVDTDEGRFLIDSGMDYQIDTFLKGYSISPETIDAVLITHMHIDHIGGATMLRTKYGIPAYMGEKDIERVELLRQSPENFIQWQKEFLRMHGVPSFYLDSINVSSPVFSELKSYLNFDAENFEHLKKLNSVLDVIKTPGHSPGSTCFRLQDNSGMFTGDHVLEKITPNISYYDETEDMLGEYLESLTLIEKYGVKTAYPGHGKPFDTLPETIVQIRHHHDKRLNEVMEICSGNPISAYEVARKMRWSKNRTMESMNLMEANFAIGEAISHLRHLARLEKIEEYNNGDRIYYKTTEQKSA